MLGSQLCDDFACAYAPSSAGLMENAFVWFVNKWQVCGFGFRDCVGGVFEISLMLVHRVGVVLCFHKWHLWGLGGINVAVENRWFLWIVGLFRRVGFAGTSCLIFHGCVLRLKLCWVGWTDFVEMTASICNDEMLGLSIVRLLDASSIRFVLL